MPFSSTNTVCVLCVCAHLLTARHTFAGKLHFLFLLFFFGHPVGSCCHSGDCPLLQHLALFKWETLHKRSFYIGRWYFFMFLILALLWYFLQSTNTVVILSASVNANKSPVYMVMKTSGLQRQTTFTQNSIFSTLRTVHSAFFLLRFHRCKVAVHLYKSRNTCRHKGVNSF